ncbi:MAG: HAMP domain-containing protein, partial [Verrucomicrobia bacterium]|nr:HAMP domain-containing protein [Verrucomicrobiota bacterium]
MRLVRLVLLVAVPAMALTLYTAVERREEAARGAEEDALRVARLAAVAQGHFIEGARQLLISLARLPEVRARDPKACSGLLAELLKQYPLYANFGVATAEGQVVCSALPVNEPVSAAGRPWFQRTVRQRGFAIGDYEACQIAGRTTLNFGYPLLGPTGQLQGVVFAALDWGWLKEVAGEAQLPEGATVKVFDQQGTILVRYPDPEQWVDKTARELAVVKSTLARRRDGTAQGIGLDGVPRLYAFTHLRAGERSGDVFLSIGIPTAMAFAEVDRITHRNLLLLVAVALLVTAVAFWGSEMVVLRRLRSLLGATKRLQTGDFSARSSGVRDMRGHDELGQLGVAFNEMAGALERHIAERNEAEKALLLDEARLEALVKLAQMEDAPLKELTDFALEEAVRLTRSQIGYLAFMNEDETVLTMHAWSKTAMEQCAIQDKPLIYPVVTTGLWGEAVRQRKPVITNDYPAPNPLKKGTPEGHVPVRRHMNVPVFDGEKIVAVAGVGNKEEPYDTTDVRQLSLLMDGMWR